MKLAEFLRKIKGWGDEPLVSFVGVKWQDAVHPSAEEFPIEFLSCSEDGMGSIKIKFVTKPRNPQ